MAQVFEVVQPGRGNLGVVQDQEPELFQLFEVGDAGIGHAPGVFEVELLQLIGLCEFFQIAVRHRRIAIRRHRVGVEIGLRDPAILRGAAPLGSAGVLDPAAGAGAAGGSLPLQPTPATTTARIRRRDRVRIGMSFQK